MMYGVSSVLILAFVLLIVVFLLVLPVQLAAGAMGAKRNGVGWCFLSLVGASFMQMVGLSVPVYGSIMAFLLSSAAFAAILDTGFLGGMGISVLHVVFSVALTFLATLVFGFTFFGLTAL